LRQALFNSIQAVVPDARVLDLFAGSGSLAFEALSRGAARAVAVETHKNVLAVLERNRAELEVEKRLRILASPVEKAWGRIVSEGPFEVILIDPPYADGWEKRILDEAPWKELVAPGGVVCLEWGSRKSEAKELPEVVDGGVLVKVREKIYGESILTTYARPTEVGGEEPQSEDSE
jgi:16S rRNA (guanine(966)-N(2))-methyltransferase RsmD